MARRFNTSDYFHTNRICRIETKSAPSVRQRTYSFISDNLIGKEIITHNFGPAIVKSISDCGNQVLEILVKGNCGLRKETIYPLHIKSF